MLVQGRRPGLRPRSSTSTPIAFPNYDGNGMFLSAGNALVNPHVGLLFIDFEERKRMRLNGIAEHVDERPAARRVPRGAVPLARARDRGVPELPALHPPLQARRALALRAEVRLQRRRCRTGSAASGRATCSPPDDPAYSQDAEVLEGEDVAGVVEAEERVDDDRVELGARRLASRRTASSPGRRGRYGRSVTIAWKASQTSTMRASSGMSSPSSVRVAEPVPALVARADDRAHVGETIDRREDLLAQLRVLISRSRTPRR